MTKFNLEYRDISRALKTNYTGEFMDKNNTIHRLKDGELHCTIGPAIEGPKPDNDEDEQYRSFYLEGKLYGSEADWRVEARKYKLSAFLDE